MASGTATPSVFMQALQALSLDGVVGWLCDRPRPDRLGAILCAAVVAVFVVLAATAGYGAGWLLSADALFPVQFFDFNPLAYRPPPSTNLFPDLLLHGIVGMLIDDPLMEKLIVGAGLFIVMMALIGALLGLRVLGVVLAIFAVSGWGFIDSTSHFTLPLMMLVWLVLPKGWPRHAALFVLVFSDLLFLLPLTLAVLIREDLKSLWIAVPLAFAASVLNVVYAEFSLGAVQFAVVLPAFALVCLMARRLGLLATLGVCLVVALPLLSLITPVPARYTVPIAAALVVALAGPGWWKLGRETAFAVAAPVIIIALFLASADLQEARDRETAYTCLAGHLNEAGIRHIAADHWAAKPLAVFGARDGSAPTITQMQFGHNQTHLWMAPHAFSGPAATHAVRDRVMCTRIGDDPRFCGHETVAPVVSRTQVCGVFDLFEYATPVPADALPVPASKTESALRQAMIYLGQARQRLGLAAESASSTAK